MILIRCHADNPIIRVQKSTLGIYKYDLEDAHQWRYRALKNLKKLEGLILHLKKKEKKIENKYADK